MMIEIVGSTLIVGPTKSILYVGIHFCFFILNFFLNLWMLCKESLPIRHGFNESRVKVTNHYIYIYIYSETNDDRNCGVCTDHQPYEVYTVCGLPFFFSFFCLKQSLVLFWVIFLFCINIIPWYIIFFLILFCGLYLNDKVFCLWLDTYQFLLSLLSV